MKDYQVITVILFSCVASNESNSSALNRQSNAILVYVVPWQVVTNSQHEKLHYLIAA